jgi:SAM-dependent methyltransferase
MPTIEENRYWDCYSWPEHGDEWSDQAAFSGLPYEVWKQDLVDHFIVRSVRAGFVVLEIGVGHGRWTPYLASRAGFYLGIDLGPSCVAYCRQRFRDQPNCWFEATNGSELPQNDLRFHFVWSYDTFVHIDEDVTSGYVQQIADVLIPGGSACIHHPGAPTSSQREAGWRSAVTADRFAAIAEQCGLEVTGQVDSWGPDQRSTTKLAGDCISTLKRPFSHGA